MSGLTTLGFSTDRDGPKKPKPTLRKFKGFATKLTGGLHDLDIDANSLAPRKVIVGQEFEIRFDVFNVSRKAGFLVKAEKLVPLEFELEKTIKLKVKASKPGTFTFNPRVSYMDELGETKTCEPNPVTLTVQPAQPKYEALPGKNFHGFRRARCPAFWRLS